MTTLRRIICFILSLLLSACALTGSDPPDRLVRVKIVGDPKLRREYPKWRESVGALVEASSDYFEREFGIGFVIAGIEPLESNQDVITTFEFLRELKKQSPLQDRNGRYDLVIGFTALSRRPIAGQGRVDEIGNCAQGLGNYIAFSVTGHYRHTGLDTALEKTDFLALVHELGHIFGAEHTPDRQSVMNSNFQYGTEFDAKNQAIILKNKRCPFRKG
ncbi:MAG: M12 family metallo-peptidase [Candidatus Binatia bacterium]